MVKSPIGTKGLPQFVIPDFMQGDYQAMRRRLRRQGYSSSTIAIELNDLRFRAAHGVHPPLTDPDLLRDFPGAELVHDALLGWAITALLMPAGELILVGVTPPGTVPGP